MVSRGVFILLWPPKDSMIFLIFILITEFNFLKLQGPLTFFDYAVFCEIEILIETRAVSLFPEKKSNNLWSPSYMQDLIKSLMEVTRTASAETHLFFTHEKHELSLRSKIEISIIHGGFVCLPMQKSKTQAGFYCFGSDPTTHYSSAVRYWALLNSHWVSILPHLLPANVWDCGKGICLFCWCKCVSNAGVYRAKWQVLHFLLRYPKGSCLFPHLITFMYIL